MNTNTIITAAIGAFIAVLVVLSVAAPIIHAGTAETLTYTNEGMPYAETAADVTHEITVDASGLTVDDELIDNSLFPEGFNQFTILFGNPGTVRYDVNQLQIRTIANSVKTMSFANGETITISISGTDATLSSTDADVSDISISGVTHYVATAGDMVLVKNPCVNSESVIIGEGQSNWLASADELPTNLAIYTYWVGTMADVTPTVLINWSVNDWETATVSDTTVNTTDLVGGLYRIDSVLIDYSTVSKVDTETYDTTSTYTYFLAPASVEYDNPNYIDATVTTIAGILPVLMIVGVMLFVVGAMISNRRA